MLILSEPFTRDLVFFGAIVVLFACLGLYGLTTYIFSKHKYHKAVGISCIILTIIFLICDVKLALMFTLN